EPHGPRDVLELPALDRSAELAAHPRLVRGLIARDPVEEREEGDNVVLAELEAGRTERVDGHVLARRSARVSGLWTAPSGGLPRAPCARAARGVAVRRGGAGAEAVAAAAVRRVPAGELEAEAGAEGLVVERPIVREAPGDGLDRLERPVGARSSDRHAVVQAPRQGARSVVEAEPVEVAAAVAVGLACGGERVRARARADLEREFPREAHRADVERAAREVAGKIRLEGLRDVEVLDDARREEVEVDRGHVGVGRGELYAVEEDERVAAAEAADVEVRPLQADARHVPGRAAGVAGAALRHLLGAHALADAARGRAELVLRARARGVGARDDPDLFRDDGVVDGVERQRQVTPALAAHPDPRHARAVI